MSTEVAVMQEMGNDKLELIKKTVAKGATDLELELFLHACKRTGLDPLMKQIYCIKRGDKMAMQTGIDGYRLIADRTGKYAGSDEPQYVLADDGWPEVASVTVTKMVDGVPCKFSASARWKEYCQESSPMWKKMPFLMLGKCAEALALRKAFPAELSGVYTHEEMMQADEEPVTKAQSYTQHKQTAQAKIAELKVEGERREDGADTSQVNLGSGPVSAVDQQVPDAAAPFIWRLGKHNHKPITEIPLDYLVWACTGLQNESHRLAAADEIDRRQRQDVMAFEGQG
jgi:phage recombination protein Bet